MERLKEFFCWIKISPPKKDEKETVASDWRVAMESLLEITRSGKASPADVEYLVQTVRNGNRPPLTRNGPRPPGRYGGSMMSGWWLVDDIWKGDPGAGLVIGYEPVLGSREDAIAWLDIPEGKKWQDGSIFFFLMSFGAIVDI